MSQNWNWKKQNKKSNKESDDLETGDEESNDVGTGDVEDSYVGTSVLEAGNVGKGAASFMEART